MPGTIEREVVIRFTADGWHSWPAAVGEREYLASVHRHLFYVEVRLAVTHDEREVEFHDLLAYCRAVFRRGDFGAASCETLAQRLLTAIEHSYPGRAASVSVFEDNECGATLRYTPAP